MNLARVTANGGMELTIACFAQVVALVAISADNMDAMTSMSPLEFF